MWRVTVVDEQQHHRRCCAERRRCERAPAVLARAAHRPRRRQGGGEHQHRGERPERFEPAVFDVVAGGDLEQVDRVCGDLHDQAQREQPPHEPRAPAREPDRGDDEQKQQQVAHRVGEVGGNHRQAAVGRVEDGVEHDARRQRAQSQSGDQPVEPHRHAGAPGAPHHQQPDPGVQQRVVEEIQRVVHRRRRGFCLAAVDERVVEVAEGPREHARADQQQRQAVAAPGERVQAQRERRAQHHDVVGDVVKGCVRRRSAEPEVDVGAVGDGQRDERPEAPGCGPGRGQWDPRESLWHVLGLSIGGRSRRLEARPRRNRTGRIWSAR